MTGILLLPHTSLHIPILGYLLVDHKFMTVIDVVINFVEGVNVHAVIVGVVDVVAGVHVVVKRCC